MIVLEDRLALTQSIQVAHEAGAPKPMRAPTTPIATAPGQVWCWDMTHLPAGVSDLNAGVKWAGPVLFLRGRLGQQRAPHLTAQLSSPP